MSGGLGTRLLRRLSTPVDGASLALFRVAFGAIMLWEIADYARHGWIARYWIEPAWHFPYWGFGWVRPWPGAGMYLHFAALAALALCIAAGLRYRIAAALFCAGFTWVFLIDQARYMNHLYLICLLSGLMAVVPAHAAFSLDARRAGARASPWIPTWSLWLLRAQFTIVYGYASLAKMNPDWLSGTTIRHMLSGAPPAGPFEPFLASEWAVFVWSAGGILFDGLVVPAVLWRRTRPFALAASLFFHLTNSWMFRIGIFPYLMLCATTLFLDPGWPRRLLARAGARLAQLPAPPASLRPRRWWVGLLAGYLVVQLALPLRHLLYPGDSSWTEEGHRFAWRMKLHVKQGLRPQVAVVADGRRLAVDLDAHLARWQMLRMATRPELVHLFALHLAEQLRAQGHASVQVYADARASLNGRRPQRLVDPSVDLAAVPRSLAPARWIVPLREPLRPHDRPPRRPSTGGGDR